MKMSVSSCPTLSICGLWQLTIVAAMLVLFSAQQSVQAASYNSNSIGLIAGKAFLTSAVKTISDNIDINESDTLTGFQYVRHFNSESALQIDYLNFGRVALSGSSPYYFVTQDDQRVDLGNGASFEVETKSVAVSAQFRSWISWSWAAQINLGVQHWSRKVSHRQLINNPDWPENKAGNTAIWSFGLVYALADVQMSLLLGSAHFGDDAIKHSQHVVYTLSYGF